LKYTFIDNQSIIADLLCQNNDKNLMVFLNKMLKLVNEMLKCF